MAALVALRHNPLMRSFAASLQRNGKPFKVVITAVMRKLIVTHNAISGQPWHHAQQT
jgi:transposase